MLIIADTATISALADIEDSTRGAEIRIEEGATIDAFVKIKPAGGNGNLRIGAGTTINSGCVLYTGNGIDIGTHCAIAANCTFAATNHEYRDRDKLIVEQRFRPSRGGIVVEDDCWIGAGAVLLDGAILRRGSVVGALGLVRGEVAAYSVNAGNPLRTVGYRE